MFGANRTPRFIKLDLTPQGATPYMSPEQQQLLKSFMLQSVHLDASLNEFASHGALTFVFKNPVTTPVEMLFAFPLMDGGAVITGITTEWDDQRITGRVRGSEEGKKEYADAIAKGHTASLVEHSENDVFMWRVGGIPGGSTVTVVTQFCGPVTMTKKFGKKPHTEITLTLPAVVPPWYGKAESGTASLAYDTATQAPARIGSLSLAPPPFTATVRSHFITKKLQSVTVTSPTHGQPHSTRTSLEGLEVSFKDLFKAAAGGASTTNLQMRWVADGIVPNMACLGSMLAGAGKLAAVSSEADAVVSQDAAAASAMEAAAAALASGPHAADARALLEKLKTQQRKKEQVCCVLYSEHDGQPPERVHITVLVDCSGSMFPRRIEKARKAVRALLTSLHPTSTFSVYLFGSFCHPVILNASATPGPVFEASEENIQAVAGAVDNCSNMGGTELFNGVQRVLSNHVPAHLRHNILILTDGEVEQAESNNVKRALSQICPADALVGIIGIGNEVTRATLRTIIEAGLGPHALMFDSDTDESIASVVVGSTNAIVSSRLHVVNWPSGKMTGSQPYLQSNSSEVCAAWALYPEAEQATAALAAEDDDWEVVSVTAATGALSTSEVSAPHVRWLGGAAVSVAASPVSSNPAAAAQLPTLLVTNTDAVRSMCIAAALARCRDPSCSRQEATKLALRYGFVCAEADSVMVALSDHATVAASSATSFGIALPHTSVLPNPTGVPRNSMMHQHPSYMLHSYSGRSAMPQSMGVANCYYHSASSYSSVPHAHCFSSPGYGPAPSYGDIDHRSIRTQAYVPLSPAYNPSPPSVAYSAHPRKLEPPLKHQRSNDDGRIAVSSKPVDSRTNVQAVEERPPSLLDVLAAMQRASWSIQHPVVAAFISKHMPSAAEMCTSDALVTIAVIVVLRAKFKDSKQGWHVHVKRAAKESRAALGDALYAIHKASLVSALNK